MTQVHATGSKRIVQSDDDDEEDTPSLAATAKSRNQPLNTSTSGMDFFPMYVPPSLTDSGQDPHI